MLLSLLNLILIPGFSPQVLSHPAEKLCSALCPEGGQVSCGLPERVRGESCPGQGAGSAAMVICAGGTWGVIAPGQAGGHPISAS